MNTSKVTYHKTHITRTYPWGLNTRTGHRVLCSDGAIRACSLAETSDTFFSIPASIRIKGKSISGYVTTEQKDYDEKKTVWAFRQHTNDNPNNTLPAWPAVNTEEHSNLIEKAL